MEEESETPFKGLNWRETEIEIYQIALDQGEKLLSFTTQTAEVLMKRVHNILKFLVPFIAIVLGFLISQKPSYELWYLEASIAMIFLVILLIKTLKSFRTYQIAPIGHDPSDVLDTRVLYFDKKKSKELLYHNLCKNVDEQIKDNRVGNEIRAKRLNDIQKIIEVGTLILIIFPSVYWVVALWLRF